MNDHYFDPRCEWDEHNRVWRIPGEEMVPYHKVAEERQRWLMCMVAVAVEAGFCGSAVSNGSGAPFDHGFPHFLGWFMMFSIYLIGTILVTLYAWVICGSIFGDYP